MFLKLTRILNKTLLSYELSVILKKGLSDRSVDTDALGIIQTEGRFQRECLQTAAQYAQIQDWRH